MRVRQVPLGDIKPYPGNPRRDHDVERIAASIKAFGWRQPIVVWEGDGYVVAGHGRLLAAQHLGQAKVPVHYVPVSEMSAEQARAYRIMDNKSADGSTWDERALLAEMELLDEDARRDAGFTEAELDEMRRRVDVEPPEDFKEYDETLETESVCPKCGYRFSGNVVSVGGDDERASAS